MYGIKNQEHKYLIILENKLKKINCKFQTCTI